MGLAVVFAVASAFSNALTLIAQHLASITAPRREKGWRLVAYLIRQPLWLAGGAAGVGAFAFQALALHFGLLSVVQPLLLIELVFVLVLRRVWIGQDIASAAWAAAVVVCVSLAVFLGFSEPTGGTASPSKGDWLSALIAVSAIIAVLSASGIRGSPAQRAAVLAAAGSLTWALMATFIKTATQILAVSGLVGLLENWSPYALAAAATARHAARAGGPARGAAQRLRADPGRGQPSGQHRAERMGVRRAVHCQPGEGLHRVRCVRRDGRGGGRAVAGRTAEHQPDPAGPRPGTRAAGQRS